MAGVRRSLLAVPEAHGIGSVLDPASGGPLARRRRPDPKPMGQHPQRHVLKSSSVSSPGRARLPRVAAGPSASLKRLAGPAASTIALAVLGMLGVRVQ